MGKPQTKKKKTGTSKHKALKLKHYARDIDQIHGDIEPEVAAKLLSQPIDEDLPGAGQHYCVQCARYFIDDSALQQHVKGKDHKKRLRELKEVPYSHEEAERCAGMTSSKRHPTMQID